MEAAMWLKTVPHIPILLLGLAAATVDREDTL